LLHPQKFGVISPPFTSDEKDITSRNLELAGHLDGLHGAQERSTDEEEHNPLIEMQGVHLQNLRNPTYVPGISDQNQSGQIDEEPLQEKRASGVIDLSHMASFFVTKNTLSSS
jgi:hypothetical protein